MKQKIVEQTVIFLRGLPKEERIVAFMDMGLNISNNIGLNRIEAIGAFHVMETEIDKEFYASRGVSVSLGDVN